MGTGVLIGVEVGPAVGGGVSVGEGVDVGAALTTSSDSRGVFDPQALATNRKHKMGNRTSHDGRFVSVLRSMVIFVSSLETGLHALHAYIKGIGPVGSTGQ